MIHAATVQISYIAICLAVMVSIFGLQTGRHRHARGCHYWGFTALAFACGWEAIDCWKYGAPGFPSSRWVLMPALLLVLAWTAIADRYSVGPRWRR